MQSRLRKRLMVIVLPSLVLGSAIAIGAGISNQSAGDVADGSAPPPERHAQRSGTGAPPSDRVFVPSKKISADKPVSFPSDI